MATKEMLDDDYFDDDKYDDEDNEREPRSTQPYNSSKIFIGNLPFTILKSDLEYMFGSFGRMIGVNIRTDRNTGKPKGFAFITYEDAASASKAVEMMNNSSIQGRVIKVNYAAFRNSQITPSAQEAVDNTWKTVPSIRKDPKTTVPKTEKPKNSWDHWAGPSASGKKSNTK